MQEDREDTWEPPAFEEILMDAEIGGYQGDPLVDDDGEA